MKHSTWDAWFIMNPWLKFLKTVHIFRELDGSVWYCVASVNANNIWPDRDDDPRWIEYIP